MFKKTTVAVLTAAVALVPTISTLATVCTDDSKNTDDITWYDSFYRLEESDFESLPKEKDNPSTECAKGYVSLGTHTPQSVRNTDNVMGKNTAASLPSSYTTPNLPAIKDQSPYGTCWAFSSVACAEINLMKKGYTNVDLSELHLAYFAYNTVTDPLGGLDDSIRCTGSSLLNMGGNTMFSTNAWSDWMGAADESVAEYSMASSVESKGLSSSLAYEDSYHLQNFYYINSADTEQIKQAIMDYGSVAVNYYAYDGYGTDPYYNSKTAAQYCNSAKTANHAVTIVGWDDNFAASNFKTRPSGNGAWVVRNSWGSDWGDGGYFYLSYYDKTIDSLLTVFDMEPAGRYDNNYQYDGAAVASYTNIGSTSKAANVFTAKANEDGEEEIAAVSFETGSVNGTYTVNVYTNLANTSNPESGTLSATKSGTIGLEGMYTVDLDTPVRIQQGETYSVVITITVGSSSKAMFAADYDYSASGWFRTVSTAKEKQSFLYYNGSWLDYGKNYDSNIRIKAYTNNVTESEDNQTGIFMGEDGEYYYYENGVVNTYVTGIIVYDNTWYYVVNGKVDSDYTGMACNQDGWVYFKDGKVDFTYTGMAENEYGKWYYVNGKIDFVYWGLGTDEDGTWFFSNGVINTGFTGLLCIDGIWYYIVEGEVLTNYTGIAENEYGKWYFNKGSIDFGYTGIAYDSEGAWYFCNGTIQTGYTGMMELDGVWRYIMEGEVILDYTGLACNQHGWWYLKNGTIDKTFTGIATNEYGSWYVISGQIDFSYFGTVVYGGTTYTIEGGMVVS